MHLRDWRRRLERRRLRDKCGHEASILFIALRGLLSSMTGDPTRSASARSSECGFDALASRRVRWASEAQGFSRPLTRKSMFVNQSPLLRRFTGSESVTVRATRQVKLRSRSACGTERPMKILVQVRRPSEVGIITRHERRRTRKTKLPSREVHTQTDLKFALRQLPRSGYRS